MSGLMPFQSSAGSITVPFQVRGMTLAAHLRRENGRVVASVDIPTKTLGVICVSVSIEEARIRAAYQLASQSQMVGMLRGFLSNGDAQGLASVAQQAQSWIDSFDRNVLNMAGETALRDLSERCAEQLGGGMVGANMLPSGRPTFAGYAPPSSYVGMPGYANRAAYDRLVSTLDMQVRPDGSYGLPSP